MEGVVGSNGLIVPPDDYWPHVREICDKYGILLISDEVMSGWGRTGQWFAVDNWNTSLTSSPPPKASPAAMPRWAR
jgi:taurine---2-oxoglutarate transaminase